MNSITRRDIDQFEEQGTLEDYFRITAKSAIYPGQNTHLGLIYVALKLNGEAGEFAEHVGKAMRDDGLIEPSPIQYEDLEGMFDAGGKMMPERRELLIKELGDIMWYVMAACRELGIAPREVLCRNLVKLADRAKRNQLRGSGDNR